MEFEWNEDGILEYMTWWVLVVNIQTGRTRECSLSEQKCNGEVLLGGTSSLELEIHKFVFDQPRTNIR